MKNKYYKYNKYNNKKYKYNNNNINNKFYYKRRNKRRNNDNILLNNNIEEQVEVNNIELENNKEETIMEKRLPLFKMALGIIILVVLLFGVTYSYFNYYKEDTRQADITSGDVYIKIEPNDAINLTISKMYPRTPSEARSRNDNYIDFKVKGKNTSPTKYLNFILDITNGENIQGKNRIDPQYLIIDLQEKVNNEYTYVKNAVPLSEFSYIGKIPINTTSEITKEYRLRVWISDTVIISDTEINRTYTQSQFANLYANLHIEVKARDVITNAENLGFTNTITGFDCQDAQCALDELNDYVG